MAEVLKHTYLSSATLVEEREFENLKALGRRFDLFAKQFGKSEPYLRPVIDRIRVALNQWRFTQ